MEQPRVESRREPIFNLPPMVTALLLANLAVHAVRWLLPDDLDMAVLLLFGFVPLRYSAEVAFAWPAVVGPITYNFLHGSMLHLIVNMGFLMAFGAGVERWLGPWRMLAFTIVCGIAAAAAHYFVYPDSVVPVIGASGATSGLFGGVLGLLRRHGGQAQRLLPIILLWIAVAVITGLFGIPGDGGAPIAWVAHIGGFAAGLLLVGRFDRKSSAPRL